MSYTPGGIIQAADYNTLATLSGSINELYADLHSGSVRDSLTYPVLANDPTTFGYGQTSIVLTSAAASLPVQAIKWANLFQVVQACAVHQGSAVVPPLPGTAPANITLPNAGDTIISYATPPGAITAMAIALRDNRFNVAPAQSTLIPGTQYPSSSSWTTLLQYTYQVDFSSWNNARYFFNAGGFLGLNGSYPSASSPIEIAWKDAIDRMSTLKFTWSGVTPGSGGGATSNGFYSLTTSYQTLYQKSLGASYYTTSYILVEAKLNAAPGTNGLIDFRVSLVDGDLTPDLKTGAISFWVDNSKSAAAVTYPGPSVAISAGSFSYA
jgi:hypothetical protein